MTKSRKKKAVEVDIHAKPARWGAHLLVGFLGNVILGTSHLLNGSIWRVYWLVLKWLVFVPMWAGIISFSVYMALCIPYINAYIAIKYYVTKKCILCYSSFHIGSIMILFLCFYILRHLCQSHKTHMNGE